MTLRRLVAFLGFCYMLASTTVVMMTFAMAAISGQSEVTILLNRFGEQQIELVIVMVGWGVLPLTIYEIDQLIQTARGDD